ncbi:MAG: PTS sugar transporter subunit IIA [Deltaproteobacteria bacterium]|nr:PTS sugar transporter subunit IIA [Deltaproteobacteria bacterium]
MLCHYLSPHLILCPSTATTKHEVIETLTHALAERHHLKHERKILQAILAREEVGSTFLPIGVAIPHARYKEVEEIKMVMGILPTGLVEDAEGIADPIHIVALFISPAAEENFGRHLKLLARIGAIFRSRAIVEETAAAPDAETAFRLLQRFEREAEELQSQAQRDQYQEHA